MFKSAPIIYFLFLSCTVNKSSQVYAQPSLDSVFTAWNKITFASLENQSQVSTNSKQRAMYENRLSTIKGYWDIEKIEDLNNKSIRYKFLEIVFEKFNDSKKDFYVIEANESGAKVLLRNFVLCINDSNIVDVEFYDFVNGEWKKTGRFKKEGFYLQSDLKNYISQFGKGFNYDDVVITEFKGNQVKESEYYLYSTLSSDSKIKVVLDGYRKENFIK